jgi:glycosyltransferase involved in cell wall biosynthesis
VDRFHVRDRVESLRTAADLVEADADRMRGRPMSLWTDVARALQERKPEALEDLAKRYDQGVPDQDAPELLRQTARHDGPILGYIGKLIPQKGVERLIEAATLLPDNVWTLIVGFGTFREWLTALVVALDDQDPSAVDWLREHSDMQLELSAKEIRATDVPSANGAFTGKLDHRYAPYALAAMDILIVPSTLAESFGMVAAEGAAAGALPLVSRHSGLAEVAAALETEVGRPGLFSFEPGNGATHRLAAGANALLALPHAERRELREAVSSFVAREWSWNGTAQRLLDAAAPPASPAAQ